MNDWLKRLLRVRRPIASRTQRAARLVTALSFYADARNYRRDAVVKDSCPVMRDGGRRARYVLGLIRE